jgi:hypothetical protein
MRKRRLGVDQPDHELGLDGSGVGPLVHEREACRTPQHMHIGPAVTPTLELRRWLLLPFRFERERGLYFWAGSWTDATRAPGRHH